MTDEEKACKAICDSIPCKTMCTKCKCYIAGLEAGRETEREYVKNNAFTSMKEQGLFPFGKWHDLRKDPNDLPLNTSPVLCLGSTGFIVCKYISGNWVDNQTIKLTPKYIDIYKWCEIEDTEE